VTDIFRTGSLLAHAASRVGAGDWASVMRARVGDVYMRWDDGDRVPLFTAIPQCPAQDTESAQDFLTGRVQRRTLNSAHRRRLRAGRQRPRRARSGASACSRSPPRSARAALSAEERQFVANVRTLPVYRMLEWGVRQGVIDCNCRHR
jgi:conjugative transfer pilus assembly protein TraH